MGRATKLGSTDAANLAAIKTAIETLDNAIAGSEQQVDIVTQPDMREAWRISLVADETANDSDKTLTVPANTEYQIQWIWVELATTADVGARQVEVRFLDAADDVIGARKAAITQAASLTYNYLFAPGVVDSLAVRDSDLLDINMPVIFLSAGQKVRVLDNNAVAAAADDMVIQMQIASRSVA